jgi:choline dehydrogenase-like flavoprotein
MGSGPEQSVVDGDHRCWEVPNLFIADGSVMPTQGSANPALTIMALASRLAERLDLKRAGASAEQQRRLPRRRQPPAPTRAGAG